MSEIQLLILSRDLGYFEADHQGSCLHQSSPTFTQQSGQQRQGLPPYAESVYPDSYITLPKGHHLCQKESSAG